MPWCLHLWRFFSLESTHISSNPDIPQDTISLQSSSSPSSYVTRCFLLLLFLKTQEKNEYLVFCISLKERHDKRRRNCSNFFALFYFHLTVVLICLLWSLKEDVLLLLCVNDVLSESLEELGILSLIQSSKDRSRSPTARINCWRNKQMSKEIRIKLRWRDCKVRYQWLTRRAINNSTGNIVSCNFSSFSTGINVSFTGQTDRHLHSDTSSGLFFKNSN